MATLARTHKRFPGSASARLRATERTPDASNEYVAGTQPSQVGDRERRAADAVALAFARNVSQRYPGTSWLPVKRGRSDDRLVVPAGKVLGLLSGPADMNTGGGIRHPAAPAAYGRATHKHGADTGPQ